MLMKIFTLFLAGSLAIGATAAPTARFTRHHKTADSRMPAASTVAPARAASANPIWVPQHQEISAWDGEWLLESIYTTAYTITGKVANETITAVEDGSATRETNTYNDNDMLATQLLEISSDGTEFTNAQKLERTYDSRITDLVVENLQWVWTSSWEQIGNNYKREITRDTNGNITSVVISTLFQGVFDPIGRLTVTYTDGRASRILNESLSYDSEYNPIWIVASELTNIEWEQTDGQIYDVEELMSGANKLRSCHLRSEDTDVDMSVIYTANGYTATQTGTIQGYPATSTVTYEITDENGSERLVETFVGEEEGETFTETYTDIAEYDSYGFTTYLKSTSEYGGETYMDNLMEGVLTYDSTHGYPLTYTTSVAEIDEETEEITMVPEMHVVMSDYVDASLAGITDITVGDTDAPAQYYRLDGTRADAANLAPGIYIVRTGAKAAKVIIR